MNAPFTLNGIIWGVKIVSPTSHYLTDRTGLTRVATTDPDVHCIYLSSTLSGSFKTKVLLHELGHAVMVSYGLVDELHQFVEPYYWVEAEEWVCNFISDYGEQIFYQAYNILGDDAWNIIPSELAKIIA